MPPPPDTRLACSSPGSAESCRPGTGNERTQRSLPAGVPSQEWDRSFRSRSDTRSSAQGPRCAHPMPGADIECRSHPSATRHPNVRSGWRSTPRRPGPSPRADRSQDFAPRRCPCPPAAKPLPNSGSPSRCRCLRLRLGYRHNSDARACRPHTTLSAPVLLREPRSRASRPVRTPPCVELLTTIQPCRCRLRL